MKTLQLTDSVIAVDAARFNRELSAPVGCSGAAADTTCRYFFHHNNQQTRKLRLLAQELDGCEKLDPKWRQL